MKVELMLERLIKSAVRGLPVLYHFLSYLYNYPSKGYLPRKVKEIDTVIKNISEYKTKIFFIQVGANDGISGDPIHKYVQKYNWRGVLIEPIPFLFKKLQQNYINKKENLTFLNCAVSAEDIRAKIIYVIDEKYKEEVPEWYFQLGSFNKNVLLSHNIPDVEKNLTEMEVGLITLQQVIEENSIHQIDFLQIDTEGYDLEVLKTLDFNKSLPKVILIEYIHLSLAERKQLIKIFKANGYKTYRCNNDFISIHQSVYSVVAKNICICPYHDFT
ncbi:MAG: FkbM family methyltransferase [Bacteroidota bacterium]|nr:FkbM family methyltransferase [Bacteroidota bacterium]